MFTATHEFPSTAGVADVGSNWLTQRVRRYSYVVALLLGVGLTVTVATRESVEPPDAIDAPAGAVLSLGERPSHNRRYVAEVVAAPAIAAGTRQSWTIRITRRNGRRVANARLGIRAWMPDQDSVSRNITDVAYVGGGRYRVDDMQFPKAGWWNVALVIDGIAGVDSLAFNLVLPNAQRTRPSVR